MATTWLRAMNLGAAPAEEAGKDFCAEVSANSRLHPSPSPLVLRCRLCSLPLPYPTICTTPCTPTSQDLKGALDELSQRIQIRFVFKPARRVEVQGRHIVLFFDRDEVTDAVLPAGVTKEELLSRTYSLTAVSWSLVGKRG